MVLGRKMNKENLFELMNLTVNKAKSETYLEKTVFKNNYSHELSNSQTIQLKFTCSTSNNQTQWQRY